MTKTLAAPEIARLIQLLGTCEKWYGVSVTSYS
jgi:hypothetical protein